MIIHHTGNGFQIIYYQIIITQVLCSGITGVMIVTSGTLLLTVFLVK